MESENRWWEQSSSGFHLRKINLPNLVTMDSGEFSQRNSDTAAVSLHVSRRASQLKLCLTVMILLWLSTLGVKSQEHPSLLLDLSVKSLTRRSYADFIEEFRGILSTAEKTFQAYWLRHSSVCSLTDRERFILVELRNGTEAITLSINSTDVYLRGFRHGNRGRFFSNVSLEEMTNTFGGTENERLRYTGNYLELYQWRKLDLNFHALRKAVGVLARFEKDEMQWAFAVAIQMVCEAARFDYLKINIIRSLGPGFFEVVDDVVRELVPNWGRIANVICANEEDIERKWKTMNRQERGEVEIEGFSLKMLATVRLIKARDDGGDGPSNRSDKWHDRRGVKWDKGESSSAGKGKGKEKIQ